MAVSAKDVKELRERTGAGMLDCKKALEEMGTIDKAIDYLREKGIAKAAKKSRKNSCSRINIYCRICRQQNSCSIRIQL